MGRVRLGSRTDAGYGALQQAVQVPGDYFYFCSIHSSANDVGQNGVGMWGLVHVFDTTATTQPPAPQPPPTQPPATQPPPTPTTATTRPSATPPATSATAPRPGPRPRPRHRRRPPPKGDKKPKDETTTTTVPELTPPPPIDLPDAAIIPSLPSAGTTTNAAPGEAPIDTPEGEAVALLKSKKRRRQRHEAADRHRPRPRRPRPRHGGLQVRQPLLQVLPGVKPAGQSRSGRAGSRSGP